MDDPDIPHEGEDPELDYELGIWAQWLLDIYLWKLEEERKKQHGDRSEEEPR